MGPLVMVVEDDDVIADAITRALTAAGFRSTVARTGEQALGQVASEHVSLIVLDLGLPDIDGLLLCRRFRADDRQRPIIIVTARDADIDVITGLDAGASDYVTKPVSAGVLVARVRAHLRSALPDDEPILRAGDLVVDVPSRAVTLRGAPVELRPRELAVLEILLRRAGRVVTRETLLRALWGDGWDAASNRALDVHVVSLRRKLGDAADHPTFIATVRGVGYRVVAS